MRPYFKFELQILRDTYHETRRFFSISRKRVITCLGSSALGLLAVFFIAGSDVLSQEVTLLVAALSGLGALVVIVALFQLAIAPYRLVIRAATAGYNIEQKNRQLRAKIAELQKPRFTIDVIGPNLAENAEGKLVCAAIIRVSNCGIIPSTLDDWQGRIKLANGEIIEMYSIHQETVKLWKEGVTPGSGKPFTMVTADQLIYERIANTPLEPGHKETGWLLLGSDYPGRPEPEFFDGATFIVDAFDGAKQKHVYEEVIRAENFGPHQPYVPGLRSRERRGRKE